MLNARVGRVMPNPLFGSLVALPADEATQFAATASSTVVPLGRLERLEQLRTEVASSTHAARVRSLFAAPQAAVVGALALLLLALWPHLAWIVRRLTDGSDEPWGWLALATVLLLVVKDRAELQLPSPRALLAGAALALLAALAIHLLPMLLAAAVAMAALAVFVTAALPRRPKAALATLLMLALPLIASLNFYLGYPLRAATAQAAAPLLALLGIDAQPAGAALVFRQLTVLVDAPCAGIGMLWLGSYSAALLSYLNGASTRRTIAHGVAAAALVFGANVLRNVALFFPEAGLVEAPAWAHEAIGLAAFAAALLPLLWLTHWRSAGAQASAPALPICAPPSTGVRATFVGACLAAAVVPLAAAFAFLPGRDAAAAAAALEDAPASAIEWPTTFRGQPLTQRALTPLEARFAQRFPGVIARFATGREVIVLRHVTRPTRQLHPAVDCFRAAGYAVEPPRAAIADDGTRWSCFVATARAGEGGERLRVCERIATATTAAALTQEWTDVSAWFWAAARARGTQGAAAGPWWATTVITPLDR